MTDKFEVLSPLGAEPPSQASTAAAPLADLAGKRIGLFWNGFTNGNLLLEAFAEHIGRRYANVEFVKLKSGRTRNWGEYPDRTLTELVRESGVHAAIAGPGC